MTREPVSHLAHKGEIYVRNAELADVDGMARCHVEAFPGRFMTEMGCAWLSRLYRFFIKHRGGVCLIGVDPNDKVVGLAVGGQPDIRNQFLRYAMVRFPGTIFSKFVTSSMVRRVLLRELRRRLGRNKRGALPSEITRLQETAVHWGNLLSICVRPECMGTGIAGELIESFGRACAAKGFDRLSLTVVPENSRAIAFYKKHGWRETDRSKSSVRFILDLTDT
jgi:ribosomal protein S18 acetylase RimI-like enzyme